jgi:hypothetical protein
MAADPVSLVSDAIGLEGEIQLSTFLDRAGEKISGSLDLRGNEGLIVNGAIGADPAKFLRAGKVLWRIPRSHRVHQRLQLSAAGLAASHRPRQQLMIDDLWCGDLGDPVSPLMSGAIGFERNPASTFLDRTGQKSSRWPWQNPVRIAQQYPHWRAAKPAN